MRKPKKVKIKEPKYKEGDKIKIGKKKGHIRKREIKKFSFVGHDVEMVYYDIAADDNGKPHKTRNLSKHMIPEKKIQ